MPKYLIVNPEISYPTDPDVIARLLAGEPVPFEQRGIVSHVAGDIVDDLPACSVEALLASGDIVPASDDAVADPSVVDDRTWADLGRPEDEGV